MPEEVGSTVVAKGVSPRNQTTVYDTKSRRRSLVMDQRVITRWCQPLRSSKNVKPPKEAFVDRRAVFVWQDPVPRNRSKHSPITERKRLVGRPPTKNGVRSRALSMAQGRKTAGRLTSTFAWKAGQNGRKIARSVDVIPDSILTGCNYVGRCPKFSLSDK